MRVRIESESDGLRGQEGPVAVFALALDELAARHDDGRPGARQEVAANDASRGDDEGRPHRQAHAVAVEPDATFWASARASWSRTPFERLALTRSSVPL